MSSDNKIFDDVFRTLLEKLPQLAVPLINEVFHTTYDESMVITQLRNEHQGKDGERITDSVKKKKQEKEWIRKCEEKCWN